MIVLLFLYSHIAWKPLVDVTVVFFMMIKFDTAFIKQSFHRNWEGLC